MLLWFQWQKQTKIVGMCFVYDINISWDDFLLGQEAAHSFFEMY